LEHKWDSELVRELENMWGSKSLCHTHWAETLEFELETIHMECTPHTARRSHHMNYMPNSGKCSH
jgi:hypothetical protein